MVNKVTVLCIFDQDHQMCEYRRQLQLDQLTTDGLLHQNGATLVLSETEPGHSKAATGGVPWKEGVLENFAKFTGKHLCQSLFLNKVAGLRLSQMLIKLWSNMKRNF